MQPRPHILPGGITEASQQQFSHVLLSRGVVEVDEQRQAGFVFFRLSH
jgi:hypothetical protein